MRLVKRLVGAALFLYAVLYTLQVVLNGFYAGVLPPSEVWQVMNYCTAVGILAAVAVACWYKRRMGNAVSPAGRYLATWAAFLATLALAIWFFTLWFRLLLLGEGEAVSEADNVLWGLVSALNPLVLGTTGSVLWKSARRQQE